MISKAPDLGLAMPAMLDALAVGNIGIAAFRHRGGKFEKWFANSRAMTMVGYTLDEWMAAPLWTIIQPDNRAQLSTLYERIAVGATPATSFELTLHHKDGRELRGEVHAGRCELPDGHGLVLLVHELSTYPKAQLPLLEADRVSLVGALASGFAHETNNPLTSVLLNLRALRKQLTTQLSDAAQLAALRCLDDITTGAERIASNVRALQTLATRSATQQIDLAALVSAALRLAAPTLEPRAHVIRQIFPVTPVVGEESRLGQAVLAMMLFSSSGFDTDVTSASNRIVVAVEDRGAAVIVEVSDNGRDLTADELQHAFDPFFRSPVRGAVVGVGLGIARSIASTLGGDVTLTSRPGGGAVITMRLPPAPA